MEKKSTTDVFMSISPEDALESARGRKTNVYRSYPLPATVRRIWFYTTAPLQFIERKAIVQLQDSPGMDVEAPYLPASGYLARHTESSPAKVLLGDGEFLG
ncbi:hypothetical protein PCH_Pc21g01330 [Penicillium rubens Wisconsin 54-1255]|uniref:Uncharacterized protein n=1 Tax=Penicillium rubens (strain ATCC 28089 / DSM 1075 / NRRL 1951 / Wisconsin 54-1255) TaxID=500485 RepID=B6HIC5_PENRW|nr:hypothetical protein PCH_Pc21g01330 [Penicillium rubens Wisconsin 54-1255]